MGNLLRSHKDGRDIARTRPGDPIHPPVSSGETQLGCEHRSGGRVASAREAREAPGRCPSPWGRRQLHSGEQGASTGGLPPPGARGAGPGHRVPRGLGALCSAGAHDQQNKASGFQRASVLTTHIPARAHTYPPAFRTPRHDVRTALPWPGRWPRQRVPGNRTPAAFWKR